MYGLLLKAVEAVELGLLFIQRLGCGSSLLGLGSDMLGLYKGEC
jgi:hypothetical protein